MPLEIDSTQLHGRVAEIVGRTERGAALIVNGQSVPNVSLDGTFRHFTEALEPGQHTISVIGSNRRAGTAMRQASIGGPQSELRKKTEPPLRRSRGPETMEVGASLRYGHLEHPPPSGR